MNNLNFVWKAGETKPPFKATLFDPNGNPVDLTGCSAVFKIRTQDLATLVQSGTMTIDADPTTGKVSYTLSSSINEAGIYAGLIVVTFADTSVQSFPQNGSLNIEIQKGL